MTAPQANPGASTPRYGLAADEARVVLVAVAACLGTLIGLRSPIRSAPPAVAAVAAILAAVAAGSRSKTGLRLPRPNAGTRRLVAGLMLVLAFTCIRGGCSARAYHPMEEGPLRADALVRGDPEPTGPGWRAEVQLSSGERLEATAFGRAGFELRQVAVGDRLVVEGRVRPIGDRPWLRSRHIVGRLSVDDLAVTAPASGFDDLVNRLRSVIVDGAASFDDRSRSLYTGLVIGDDRFQPLAQKAQFRASGLTHLLAVSGQNVAFVLLVVRPLLMLCSRRIRLVVIVGVLVLFAAMTRAEPSVLRAATAAGVAAWALVTGRTGSGLRTLAAGVAGLVVVDPFLIDVVGFQLSVAASGGIIVVAPLLVARLSRVLPGVRGTTPLAQALAVTVGAQIGVAPLLVHHFGPLPLASIPANLIAGWAAGAVMTLGLTVGPISGLLHRARLPDLAASLQWPSRQLVAWIDGTARWSADLDLPRLGLGSLGMLVLLGAVAAVRPRHPLLDRIVMTALLMVLSAVMAAGRQSPPTTPATLAQGVLYFPGAAAETSTVTVLVVADPPPSAVDAVLASGIDRVDLVITTRGDPQAARIVGALIEVVDTVAILAPPQHRIPGATRVTEPTTVATAWGVVTAEPDPTGSKLVIVTPPADFAGETAAGDTGAVGIGL